MDYDGDGYDDLYFCNSGQANFLYRNNGDLTFTNVTELAGVGGAEDAFTNAASWADFDNDGWPDLYIANHNTPNSLFKNNGDGTFTDVATDRGVDFDGFGRAANWIDINSDGFLDLYVSNMNMSNVLYISQEGESFIDAIDVYELDDLGVAQGTIFFDYDVDGDQDLYLVHDADQANILYVNVDGQYLNLASWAEADYEGNGMGVDAADYNNDGLLDLYFTNLGHNTLLSNNGDGTFTDISEDAGVQDLGMGWGTFFFDYDNDRLTDIYVCNDYNFAPLTNKLYRNQGDSTFVIVSEGDESESALPGWGAATLDLDLDGRLDMALGINGLANPNQVLINHSDAGNWIGFTLEGVESNRAAIGSRVVIHHAHGIQADELHAGCSWASHHAQRLHFGLDELESIDSVEVFWPSGFSEAFTNLDIGEYHHLVEGESIEVEPPVIDQGPMYDPESEIVLNLIERAKDEAIIAYPNPAQDNISIILPLLAPIGIFNSEGRKVFSESPANVNFTIELNTLSSGVYVIRSGEFATRFVKY